MTIKELEKEVKEIKEMVKSLVTRKEIRENTTEQLTINGIKVGEQFSYCGHKYTKLNENNYCIIDDFDDSFMYCIFDPISNDYSESMIRQYINSDRFINRLGVNIEDLIDYITLISKEEYEAYGDLIKNYDAWFWLRSADSDDSLSAYCVFYSGDWCYSNVNDFGRAARVALILKSETEVEKVNE